MNDPRKPNSPISHDNLVKMAKENLNKEEVVKELDKSPAGLKRPCTFGKHSGKIDKNVKKRKSL